MRMPITAIPSVIKDIAQTFNVETTSLGILTIISSFSTRSTNW